MVSVLCAWQNDKALQQSINWCRHQGSWEKQRWLNSGHPKLAENEGGSAGRKWASMWYPFLLIFSLQVADFGLARLALDAVTHVTTRVMGTFGWVKSMCKFRGVYCLFIELMTKNVPFFFLSCRYMAPEYASSGEMSNKSDVFSFGVVLLELMTGRKPVDA